MLVILGELQSHQNQKMTSKMRLTSQEMQSAFVT